jgi:CheY-like chemotaxis protein
LKPLKVLYVEDEVLVALDGEAILRELGFGIIVVAMTFQDALAAVSRQQFDLAVLDINLGGNKTSLPLADMLLARGTPVLFLSGYTVSDQLRQRINAPILTKPFHDATLTDAILSVLGAAPKSAESRNRSSLNRN